MQVLSASNLKKSFGPDLVFENISFSLEKNDKVGLIGVNGSGKTTLFNLLTGDLAKDGGEIYLPNDVKLGYLHQQINLDSEETVYDYCLTIFSDLINLGKEVEDLTRKMSQPGLSDEEVDLLMEEYGKKHEDFENRNGYAYKSEITGTLIGMGFKEEDFSKKINELSGGQKARVQLACLILEKPDLILLDEPTNHLDISAIKFLETFVKNFGGAVIVISHDRYFLDNTVNKIFLLERGALSTYNGNYTQFITTRKKELEDKRHLYDQQQKEIKRQEEMIFRMKNEGGSKRKRGISQSRSRQKALDKLERLEKPPEDSQAMRLRFTPRIQSGEDVLKVSKLEKSFGDEPVFKNISFDIYRKDRVSIIGENGVGKTTLFRIILGEMEKDGGRLRLGSSVKVGYFDQEQASLNDENTVFDEIHDLYPMMTNFEVRSNLAKFMFFGDDVFKVVGDLSGGERARISLLKLMLSDCNFILMDEPTNHLDIMSKEALEDAILAYDGTCLIISHDRYFLNKISQKILVMYKDRMEEYLGNYDYYLEKSSAKEESQAPRPKLTKTQQKKEEQKQKLQKREVAKVKKEVQEIEERLSQIEEEVEGLNQKTLEEDFYSKEDLVKETFDKLKALSQEKEELTDLWFEKNVILEEN